MNGPLVFVCLLVDASLPVVSREGQHAALRAPVFGRDAEGGGPQVAAAA
ncbi:hypothetical protein ACIQGA_22945 [[Kitasatospora] papulosa]